MGEEIENETYIGIDMASGLDHTAIVPFPLQAIDLDMTSLSVGEGDINNLKAGYMTFNPGKISKELRKELFNERMENNWLKMHGYPKRRRIKKRFRNPDVIMRSFEGIMTEDGKFVSNVGNGTLTFEFQKGSE